MAAQLGSPACGGHTGSTGTHDDHVKVLGLVGGDVAQLAHRGLHFLHAQAVGDNGLGLVGLGGGNGHALGLIDAALGSLPDGIGGDGCAGWPSTSLDCASRIFLTISSAMSAP